MNKVIALSIFGFNNEHKDCHSFSAFLRFLSITLRAYDTLFNGWHIYLAVDKESYAEYQLYFDYCKANGIIGYLEVLDRKPLTRNMLWRLNPVAWADYTICRDIDSLPTYRERQAVEVWIKNDTLAHSINDSVSHGIPLMGGMIGFKKNAFNVANIDTCGIDYTRKGADQDFLNQCVYPQVKHSITEHRVLGLAPSPENKFSYNHIQNIAVDGVPQELLCDEVFTKRADALVNHIGQGGFFLEKTHNTILDRWYEGGYTFWKANSSDTIDLLLTEIEMKYPDVFYWVKK